jgi:Putative peptidoglycan binding domain
MANLLNSISSFITRHMDSAPLRGAVQATSAPDGDRASSSPVDAASLPPQPAAQDDSPAMVEPMAAGRAERGGGDHHDAASERQLPLAHFPTARETFAAPKLRPSRTLSLQRASTSVTVPARTVVATRINPSRQHDLPAATLTLTETERVRLQIMQVQIRLHGIALYEGPIDGTLNPETVTGVRHFQTLKGLRPTGTLAVGTLTALGVRLIV